MNSFLSAPHEAPALRVRRMDGVVFGFCLGVAALCALAGGGSRWILAKDRPSPAPTTVTYLVGGQAVKVSSAWLRPGAPPPVGSADQIELSLDARALTGDPAGTPAPMALSLRRSDQSVSPAERPSQLYARFLDTYATRFPSGLIRRSFRADTPYSGEALFVAPPDGRIFAARCLEQPGAVKQSCLAEFRLGGLDVQARFAPELLDRWSLIERGVRRILAEPLP